MTWQLGTRARVKEEGSSGKAGGGTSVESGDAGGGADNSSGTTEVSGGRAVAFDGETVDSGSATGILDGQSGARAGIMEIRAEGWGSRW